MNSNIDNSNSSDKSIINYTLYKKVFSNSYLKRLIYNNVKLINIEYIENLNYCIYKDPRRNYYQISFHWIIRTCNYRVLYDMVKRGHEIKLLKKSEMVFLYDMESFLRYFNQQEEGVDAMKIFTKQEIEYLLVGFYQQYKTKIHEMQMVDLLDLSIKASNLFFLKYYYNDLIESEKLTFGNTGYIYTNSRADLLDAAFGSGDLHVLEYVYFVMGINKGLNSKSSLINSCKYSINKSVSFNFLISHFNLSISDINEILQRINPFKLDKKVVLKLFSNDILSIDKVIEVISNYFEEEFVLKNSNIIQIFVNVLNVLNLIYVSNNKDEDSDYDNSIVNIKYNNLGKCKMTHKPANDGVKKIKKSNSINSIFGLTSNHDFKFSTSNSVLKASNNSCSINNNTQSNINSNNLDYLLKQVNGFIYGLENDSLSQFEKDRKIVKFFIFEFLNNFEIKKKFKEKYLFKIGLEYIIKYREYELLEFIIKKQDTFDNSIETKEKSNIQIDTNSFSYKYGIRFATDYQLFKYIYENYRESFSWNDCAVGGYIAEKGDLELMKYIHDNDLNSGLVNPQCIIEYSILSPNVEMVEYLLLKDYPILSFNLNTSKYGNPNTLLYILEKTNKPLNLNISYDVFNEKKIAQIIKFRLENKIDHPSRYKTKGIPYKSISDIITQLDLVLERPSFLFK